MIQFGMVQCGLSCGLDEHKISESFLPGVNMNLTGKLCEWANCVTSLENGSLMNGKVHVTWLVSSMCDDDGLCRVVGAMV